MAFRKAVFLEKYPLISDYNIGGIEIFYKGFVSPIWDIDFERRLFSPLSQNQ
jgi:hypothetical protein